MIRSFSKRIIQLMVASLVAAFLAACNGNPLPGDPGGNENGCPSAPLNMQLTDIQSLTDWINAMDKPLSLQCFVQSLPRPLNINTSLSPFSAQPALGSRSPRVFFLFDKLIMTVAIDQDDDMDLPVELEEHLLEFSFITDLDNALAIKGEFAFPIIEPLSDEDPYTRLPFGQLEPGVQRKSQCAFCHDNSKVVDTIGDTLIYESDILKPMVSVEIADLAWEHKRCDASQEAHRCSMYSSLMDHGELIIADFPPNSKVLQ